MAMSKTDNETTDFLSLFGDLDELFYFQAIDDLKKNRPSSPMFSNFENAKKYLHALNGEQFGICFCVNELAAGATARNATSIARVRALFVDLDGSPLDSVSTFALQPHCIVESSAGKYHAYWLVKDVTLSEFANLQRKLAKKFHGDLSICDLSRVMRLPGFVHHKGDPFVSRIIEINEHLSFYVSKQFHDCLESESSENKLETVSNCASSEAFCTNADLNDIRGALDAIPSTSKADREFWLKIGMALKAELGDAGFAIWDNWSKSAPNYGGTLKAWNSFKRGGVTILTLFELAKEFGYHGQNKSPRKETIDIRPSLEKVKNQQPGETSIKESLLIRGLYEIQPVVDDDSELLKNRFLTRGSSALLFAGTGCGKSSFIFQASILWALGKEFFGIEPAKPLKTLIIQGENDDGDIFLDTKGIGQHLGLNDSTRTLVSQNVKVVNDSSHAGCFAFGSLLTEALRAFSCDLVIVDPLFSYLGTSINEQGEVSKFLRNTINPIIQQFNIGILLVHHTGKPTFQKEVPLEELAYKFIGSSELANWARAILAIQPIDRTEGLFKLSAAKRGSKLKWQGGEVEKYIVQAPRGVYDEEGDELIYWRNPSDLDVQQAAKAEAIQKIRSYSKTDKSKKLTLGEILPRIVSDFNSQELEKNALEVSIKRTYDVSRQIARDAIISMLSDGNAVEIPYNPNTGEKKKIKISCSPCSPCSPK